MFSKMFVVIALAFSAVLAYEPGHAKETFIYKKFNEYIVAHGKNYPTIEEYTARFEAFKTNYLKIEQFSLDTENNRTYTMEINKFSDMTEQEFRATYRNLKIGPKNFLFGKNVISHASTIPFAECPETLDWKANGAVGPVKDQGQCGSCWAFSTIGNLEGKYQIQNNKSVVLSEQELVDCDKIDEGCNGGLMANAFDWIKANGGVTTQKVYPYTARDGKCRFNKRKAVVQVANYTLLESTTEEEIIKLLQDGPVSVAINANTLQSYSGGIIDANSDECNPEELDHGVVLYGYTKDALLLRNSWGADWGEKGYFRFKRGSNVCGINKYIASANLV